jgi:hypothetical protein
VLLLFDAMTIMALLFTFSSGTDVMTGNGAKKLAIVVFILDFLGLMHLTDFLPQISILT